MRKGEDRDPHGVPPEHDPTGLIVNSLPGLFYLFRAADGRMLRWNRNLERVSGHHAEIVAGMTALEFFPEEDLATVRAAIDQALDTGAGQCEARILRADGTLLPHHFAGCALHWQGERCICGLGVDISARLAAENELERARDRLVDAIESMREGFAYYDADDRLQLFNSTYRAMYPRSAAMIRMGETYEAILRYGAEQGEFPQAVGRVDEWVNSILAWRRHASDEALEIAYGDGRWARIHERATADGGMVGVRADITDLKQREQELRESEERYRKLVEHSPDAVFVAVAGRLHFANPAAARIAGAPRPDALQSLALTDIVLPRDHDTLGTHVKRVEGGRTSEPREYEIRRLDGDTRWVEAVGVPIRFAGRPAVLGVARDISDRKAAEARYRALFNDARDAIVLIDTDTGRVVDANRRAERLFARTCDALLALPVTALHPDDLDPPAAQMFQEHVDSGGTSALETEIVTGGGDRVPVEINMSLVRDGAGHVLAQGIFRDMTARRREEQRAAERNHVLELIARDTPLAEILAELGHSLERQCPGLRARALLVNGERLEPAGGSPVTLAVGVLTDRPAADAAAPPVPLPDSVAEWWSDCPRDRGFWGLAVLDRRHTPVGAIAFAHSGAACDDAQRAFELSRVSEAAKLAAIAIEQQQLADRLAHQAHHDALTGLPNRVLLTDRLEQAIARAERWHRSVAVVLLDLDDFKVVNDSLGHGAGDRLLQEVGGRLRECMRSGDTVARLGGDEFVLVLPEADAEVAAHVANKVIEILHQPARLFDRDIVTTPSLGISIFPDDGALPASLLQAADTAMYEAKTAGRNRYRFFAETMNEAVTERLRLETDLRASLAGTGLTLRYQPRVCLRDGRVNAAEALVRWQHPTRGLLSPRHFLEIAEQSNLIAELDQWVLATATAQVADWANTGRDWRVSVNISARELHDPAFIDRVASILAQSGAPASLIELEITESSLMRNARHAIDELARLKQLVPGLRVALDDFGSGYSSLAYLRELPIDTLKIDRKFVHDLGPGDAEHGARALLRSIIELGHNLGMEVLAEGVEQGGQHELVRALGCHSAQGFYYSAALTAEAFEEAAERIGGATAP